RVRIVVRVRRDLDEVHALDQPVHEVRKRRVTQTFGERIIDVGVPSEDVGDRLRRIVGDELVTAVESLHAGRALRNVEIERTLPELLREDEFGELAPLISILELVLEIDEQQR